MRPSISKVSHTVPCSLAILWFEARDLFISLLTSPLTYLFLSFIALWGSCTSPKVEEMTPILTIEGGKVQGVELQNSVVYRGIPYAAPPVDSLRWQLPQPVQPWDSVLSPLRMWP